MNNTREQQITKTSIVGIVANVILAAVKAILGALSGSVAIVMDALNNLTDAMSSVITIVGIKLAKRRPDHKHPYGYGRIEYFSAVLIAGIILAAGITSLVESVQKIFDPELPDFQPVVIVLVALAVVVKFFLGKYVKHQGEKYNSDSLVASGTDATMDSVVSATTLLGAAITLIFHISVDGILGTLISLLIIKAGLETLLEAVSDIMGNRADAEITRDIKKTVASIDGVLGAYDLVLHNYGPDSAIGSVHIEIPSDLTANQIHHLTKKIQNTILNQFHVFLTVGLYAVDEAFAQERALVKATATAHEGVLGAHGIYIDPEEKYMSFDAVADFTVRDKAGLCDNIRNELLKTFEGYQIAISLDTNYSD